ncbi:hypothetical protein GCM10010435_56050 [Winogradskya consettensis]|uniref:Uncharacterized protein n=1 Tax=Winogradskya consettensis TaxID=113560 RepID=A0A919S8C8_9ACTN|nr:hypothetical protein Aco04nite_06270 [Actinoplanes consettensis]
MAGPAGVRARWAVHGLYLVSVAVGLTVLLGISFAFAGPLAVFVILMAQSALSLVLIAKAVLGGSGSSA